jgi:hypothetical protein
VRHYTLRLFIRRACDFSIFSCFLHIRPAISSPDKAVILSEALRGSIANGGLYGAESKDPGDACWQMLLGAFRPQTTTEDKKVTNSERTRISCFTALTGATYVVLPKENHTQLTVAATLDRKSGGADLSRRAVEGSAVPRTSPGNAKYYTQTELSSRPEKSWACHSPMEASIGPSPPARKWVQSRLERARSPFVQHKPAR